MRTRMMGYRAAVVTLGLWACLLTRATIPARAQDPAPTPVVLDTYFPPAEDQGGWRSLLPEAGDPTGDDKAKIRDVVGVDWDRLKAAWDHNAAAPGASGLLVIRKGFIVGEWYKDGDR